MVINNISPNLQRLQTLHREETWRTSQPSVMFGTTLTKPYRSIFRDRHLPKTDSTALNHKAKPIANTYHRGSPLKLISWFAEILSSAALVTRHKEGISISLTLCRESNALSINVIWQILNINCWNSLSFSNPGIKRWHLSWFQGTCRFALKTWS